jgi:protein-disulfide isomerase
MRRLKLFLATVLSVMLISWSLPVQADSKIDPNFEQQVLQVIRKNPQAIVDSVQAYQREQQQEQRKVQQSFLQDLKQNPKSIIGQSPTKGTGKTVLIEFSDFQCPFCQGAAGTVKQFVGKYSDRVTLVYKHLPLTSIHEQALPAAKASWAAQQQGKFWQYHDALFERQQQLDEAVYPEIAKTLGLDIAKFNRDRASQAAQTAIEKDLQLADQLGISGTPFFAMNGQAFSGAVDLATLEKNLTQAQ